MTAKRNPLRLNPLQLKTLTILQELARSPATSTRDPDTGEVTITMLPQPHGNHMHVGRRVVASWPYYFLPQEGQETHAATDFDRRVVANRRGGKLTPPLTSAGA